MYVPANSLLQITGNMTLDAWVKTGTSGGYPYLIAESGSTGYSLNVESDNALFLTLATSATSTVTFLSTQAITTGTWTNVAATVSIASGTATVQFYINGALSNTRTAAMSAIYSGTGPLILGCRTNGNNDALVGLMDQVTIYDTVLTATQIEQFYTDGL